MLYDGWVCDIEWSTHQEAAICHKTCRQVQGVLQASTEYDWRIEGVPVETPLECDERSFDAKLLESHARLVQAFLANGQYYIHIK
jgi:hypothetical protein